MRNFVVVYRRQPRKYEKNIQLFLFTVLLQLDPRFLYFAKKNRKQVYKHFVPVTMQFLSHLYLKWLGQLCLIDEQLLRSMGRANSIAQQIKHTLQVLLVYREHSIIT